MPILPIIDLLILLAWTVLISASGLKLIALTTSYRPEILGLGPLDLTLVAGVLLLFSLALAARTWLRGLDAQNSQARNRAASTLQAYSEVQAQVRRTESPEGELAAAPRAIRGE